MINAFCEHHNILLHIEKFIDLDSVSTVLLKCYGSLKLMVIDSNYSIEVLLSSSLDYSTLQAEYQPKRLKQVGIWS